MASVLAIISKKLFEKAHADAKLGDVLAIDSYACEHVALGALQAGGSLVLVTVRPPGALWIVAILDEPFFEDGAWRAQLNNAPITDVTGVVGRLMFESGKGIAARDGALGQALQTPRVLTPGDEALLRSGELPPKVPAHATEAQLVEQLIDDDAAHGVLMDWLLERGDVRGEAMRRFDQVSGHEKLWLDALYEVTLFRKWRHGLLDAFELADEDAAREDVWQRALESAWLRTVRRIAKGRAKPARYRAFVTSELAQSIEEVSVPNAAFLDRLLAHPRPGLRRLVLERPTAAMRDRLFDAALPRLAALVLRARDKDIDEVVGAFIDLRRPGLEVTLSAPLHHDWQDEVIRRDMVTWLRAARPIAVAERLYRDWWTTYRTRALAPGTLELEVTTDDFGVDEVLTTEALAPSRLVIGLREGKDLDRQITELLDNSNTWWLGTAVRDLFARFGRDRIELRGAYARLSSLFP